MNNLTQSNNWGQLSWSEWIPLNSELVTYQEGVSTKAGLYRVRSKSYNGLIYIGQTGRNLRERTRALAKHTYNSLDNPPWNDPHTAAPTLWAFRHEDKFEYEVSVAVKPDYGVVMRQSHEDYLLYLHRLEHGYSTLANHGRRHPLWSKPSNKSKSRSMKRQSVKTLYPSLEKAGLNNEFSSSDWLGLEWSKPCTIKDIQPPIEPGVYKIFNDDEMLYCGESINLLKRMATHRRNVKFQGATLSFVAMKNVLGHQLKEREVDLIGAYFEQKGTHPIHQYSNG